MTKPHNNDKQHTSTKTQSSRLLPWAVAAAVLSMLLFILNNGFWQLAARIGVERNDVYAVGHLLAAFGFGWLLWSVVKVIERSDKGRDNILRTAVILVVAYHLVSTVAYFNPNRSLD